MIVKIRKMLPHVLFHHDLHLMVFKPRGIITKKRLDAAIEMLEREEDRAEVPFNRFADLSKIDAIDVDFKSMFRFSLHRRLSYSRRSPVKSAIYVTSPAAAHIAKVHVLLTEFSPLKVKMFKGLAPAAKWLGVSLETLTLDPWTETGSKSRKYPRQ
jgi:hypothetical protein